MPKKLARAETDNKSWEVTCYENLCNAIILRAIDDVLESEEETRRMHILDVKKDLFIGNKKRKALQFLKSEWFNQLNRTGYSGMELLNLARLYRPLYGRGRGVFFERNGGR